MITVAKTERIFEKEAIVLFVPVISTRIKTVKNAQALEIKESREISG